MSYYYLILLIIINNINIIMDWKQEYTFDALYKENYYFVVSQNNNEELDMVLGTDLLSYKFMAVPNRYVNKIKNVSNIVSETSYLKNIKFKWETTRT